MLGGARRNGKRFWRCGERARKLVLDASREVRARGRRQLSQQPLHESEAELRVARLVLDDPRERTHDRWLARKLERAARFRNRGGFAEARLAKSVESKLDWGSGEPYALERQGCRSEGSPA